MVPHGPEPVVGHGPLRRRARVRGRRDLRGGERVLCGDAPGGGARDRRRRSPGSPGSRCSRSVPPARSCSSGRTSGPRSAGLAFTDWPLMNGRLVPALGGAATAMFVASRPGRRRLPARALGRDPRADDGRPLEGPRRAVHARALPVRGADPLGRAERVVAAASMGRGAARRALGPDLVDARRARDASPAGCRVHASTTAEEPAADAEDDTRRAGGSLRDTSPRTSVSPSRGSSCCC